MPKIKFVSDPESNNKNRYTPEMCEHKFYQICRFKDPETSKYNVRILTFDQNLDLVKESIKQCNSSQCRLLMKSNRNHYKLYPTFDINLIDYPDCDDLLKLQSHLLSNDSSFNNFSSFSNF